jgi:hypothetical protein
VRRHADNRYFQVYPAHVIIKCEHQEYAWVRVCSTIVPLSPARLPCILSSRAHPGGRSTAPPPWQKPWLQPLQIEATRPARLACACALVKRLLCPCPTAKKFRSVVYSFAHHSIIDFESGCLGFGDLSSDFECSTSMVVLVVS